MSTLAAGAVAATACSVPVGLPKGEDQERLTAKAASIVLLRFVAASDGSPLEALDTRGLRLVLRADNIDTGDVVAQLNIQSPTPDTKKDGWVYFLLEPGRYHLIVRVDTDRMAGRFFTRVPATGSVLYAGSFALGCNSTKANFLEPRVYHCWLDGPAADETQLAEQIALASFSEYGPLITAIVKSP